MSVKIKLKHSSVVNKAPQPSDLDNGELALNTNAASPAAYIKDSNGSIVKLAGAGAIGDDWTRTGTVLSPVTAGDQVHTATGSLTVGGTAAAPNISLNANGKIQAKTTGLGAGYSYQFDVDSFLRVALGQGTFGGKPKGFVRIQDVSGTGTTNYTDIAQDSDNLDINLAGGASFRIIDGNNTNSVNLDVSGGVRIGGTLPASPNISLKADGSATFRGTINLPNVPVYADNAAARAGGLVAGDVFRNTASMLVIVS